MRCRLCDSEDLLSVLDLGVVPSCERFLRAEQLELPETTYPLHVRLCEECLLLQIPAPTTHENAYSGHTYYASRPDSSDEYARRFVEEAVHDLGLGPHSSIIEVASNDGYLLRHAMSAGIPCLGIEPSVDVGAAARRSGVPTLTAFLDEGTAEDIRREYGPADLVVANSVYASVPDLLGFTRALRILLADDGWLSLEVPHSLNLIRSARFDTVDHRHFEYFTVLSAQRALATANLCVVDVESPETRAGHIRIRVRPEEYSDQVGPRVHAVLEQEQEAGLHAATGYTELEDRARSVRRDLLRFLLHCRARDLTVVGYGATRNGNTLLHYCGISTDLMSYTVDPDPYKHGRYTPGTHIPIHPPEDIDTDRPDVVVALLADLEMELTERLRPIGQWGGRLVSPLPALHATIGSTDFVRSSGP